MRTVLARTSEQSEATLNRFSARRKNAPKMGAFSLAQRRGFAPLAARPAGQLSIAHFASRVLFFLCMQGKTLVLTRGSHPRILFSYF